MNSAAVEEKLIARRRTELSGSIYTLLFLVVATLALHGAFSVYLDGLVRGGQISRWTSLLRYVHSGLAAVFLAQLAIVMCLYRFGPLRMTLRDMGLTSSAQKWTGPVWGLLAGLLVSAVSLPLVQLDRYNDVTDLIIADFFHARLILLVIVFAILLPAATEIVFRGIVFRTFLESSSLVPALLLNALVFALVWPLFNAMTGFLLGLTTALLYHRFRSVVPAVVANVVLTTAYAAALVLRGLY